MLRKLRIALAVVCFVLITLLFCGIGTDWWGFLAHLQFLPSCLALNFLSIALILLLTFVFGRLYCSVICPMGVYQDLVIFLRRQYGILANKLRINALKRAKKKGTKAKTSKKSPLKHYGYRKEHRIARYTVLAVTVLSAVCSLQLLLVLLAPYSGYGRMVHTAFDLISGVNVPLALLLTAILTFVLISVCAWMWGREWCNTVCPVGSALSLVSRYALFRPEIDSSKCVACGRCYSKCKAYCIDGQNHKIDSSRCVVCFDCLDNCSEGAIRYRFRPPFARKKAANPVSDEKKTAGPEAAAAQDSGVSRRAFLSAGALALGSAALQAADNKVLHGAIADIAPKSNPTRKGHLVPFGAKGEKHFYDRCTACQLCVSNCPNEVLSPSKDLGHLLQPVMGYEKGYCRPECNECGKVCPAGAILPLETGAKLNIRIGTAKVDYTSCLAAKGEAGCGNCARHCPVGAVRMVNSEETGRRIPVVAEEQCIGCGACEYLCPVRPLSAITVDALSSHIDKLDS